jgi:hypothetical protein
LIRYDAEYTLLAMVARQGMKDHEYSDLEVVITEVCYLFLMIGPRGLPPQVKMCDMNSAWLKRAILRLLDRAGSTQATDVHSLSCSPSAPKSNDDSQLLPKLNDRHQNPNRSGDFGNAIIWGLYFGRIVAGVGPRPEYSWFKERFNSQLKIMGLKSRNDLRRVLRLFPYSERYRWIGLHKLDVESEDWGMKECCAEL